MLLPIMTTSRVSHLPRLYKLHTLYRYALSVYRTQDNWLLKPKVTWFWLALNWKFMATRKSSRIAAKAKPLVKRTCRTPESAGKRIQCCICLGDISIRGRLSVCKHKFCYTCILEWSKVQQLCTKRIVMVFICRTSTRAQSARKDSGVSRE